MMFTHVPLLPWSEAAAALLRLVRPLVMSFRRNLETAAARLCPLAPTLHTSTSLIAKTEVWAVWAISPSAGATRH
jgi:hypothetical protein